jgi:hypothetical protein
MQTRQESDTSNAVFFAFALIVSQFSAVVTGNNRLFPPSFQILVDHDTSKNIDLTVTKVAATFCGSWLRLKSIRVQWNRPTNLIFKSKIRIKDHFSLFECRL